MERRRIFSCHFIRVSYEELRTRKLRLEGLAEMKEIMAEQKEFLLEHERYEELPDTEAALKMLDEFEAELFGKPRRETPAEKRARLLAEERYEELARLHKRGLKGA